MTIPHVLWAFQNRGSARPQAKATFLYSMSNRFHCSYGMSSMHSHTFISYRMHACVSVPTTQATAAPDDDAGTRDSGTCALMWFRVFGFRLRRLVDGRWLEEIGGRERVRHSVPMVIKQFNCRKRTDFHSHCVASFVASREWRALMLQYMFGTKFCSGSRCQHMCRQLPAVTPAITSAYQIIRLGARVWRLLRTCRCGPQHDFACTSDGCGSKHCDHSCRMFCFQY